MPAGMGAWVVLVFAELASAVACNWMIKAVQVNLDPT